MLFPIAYISGGYSFFYVMLKGNDRAILVFASTCTYYLLMLAWVHFYDKPMDKTRRLFTAADGSEKKHVIKHDGYYHVVSDGVISRRCPLITII